MSKNEILETLKERLQPVIDKEVAEWNCLHENVLKIKKQAEDCRRQIDRESEMLDGLEDELSEAMLDGKAVSGIQKRIDACKKRGRDATALLEKYESEVLPKAEMKYRQRQGAIDSATNEIINDVRGEVGKKAGAAFVELVRFYADWIDALNQAGPMCRTHLEPTTVNRLWIADACKALDPKTRFQWKHIARNIQTDLNICNRS